MNCTAVAQAIDCRCVKSQLLKYLVAVFADFRRSASWHLFHAVNLDRTADGEFQVFAAAFQRNDDVVLKQLRIAYDLIGSAHEPIRDVRLIQDLTPVSHWLRTESLVEDFGQSGRSGCLFCGVGDTG